MCVAMVRMKENYGTASPTRWFGDSALKRAGMIQMRRKHVCDERRRIGAMTRTLAWSHHLWFLKNCFNENIKMPNQKGAALLVGGDIPHSPADVRVSFRARGSTTLGLGGRLTRNLST